MKIYFEQFKFIADPLKTWDRSWIRLDLYLRSQNRVVYFEKKKITNFLVQSIETFAKI